MPRIQCNFALNSGATRWPMIITNAQFLVSNVNYKSCPPPDIPEYAFIGRSNVGKSSLINMLCNRKGLAKTSVSPGKTQLINHFLINESWYLVDLPGYGYAKSSKKNREKWKKMIEEYLVNRENLVSTFVLIDLRIPPQKIDRDIIDNFGENHLPLALVFTKFDKLSKAEAERNLVAYKKDLQKNWEELPPLYVSSSKTGMGRDEILDFIESGNRALASTFQKK
jgi:GTP-binding protein